MELIINLKIQGCSDEYASINLSEPLSLSYSEDTTIGDLKSFVDRQCGDEIVMGDVDLEYMGDERILINEIKLQRLVEFLETSDITLFYPCGRGGVMPFLMVCGFISIQTSQGILHMFM